MEKWQILKDGVPVQVCTDINEAEKVYTSIDADEIRRITDD